MTKGLVSVIVPCYQQEQFIGQALQSICDQTYQDWQCVVVDDGSTDSSKEIILKFVESDARVNYIFQENSGVSAARNRGFLEAQGEFISFLDGDDLIKPDKILHQVEYFLDHPDSQVCYCDHIHRFEAKGIDEYYETKRLSTKPLEDFLFLWDRGLAIPPHCGMFRRSIWDQDEKPFAEDYKGRWEDWVFWIGLCLRKCQFSFIDSQDAVYRIHSANFSGELQSGVENAIRAAFYVAPKLPEEYRERFLSETIFFHMDRYANWQSDNKVRQSIIFKGLKRLASPFNLLISEKVRAQAKSYLFGSRQK